MRAHFLSLPPPPLPLSLALARALAVSLSSLARSLACARSLALSLCLSLCLSFSLSLSVFCARGSERLRGALARGRWPHVEPQCAPARWFCAWGCLERLSRLSLSHADMHYRGRCLRTSLETSKRAPARQRVIPGLVCSGSRLPVRLATSRAARHSCPSLSLPAVLAPVSARARSVPACCADLSLSLSL
jgi:hypothetical protein